MTLDIRWRRWTSRKLKLWRYFRIKWRLWVFVSIGCRCIVRQECEDRTRHQRRHGPYSAAGWTLKRCCWPVFRTQIYWCNNWLLCIRSTGASSVQLQIHTCKSAGCCFLRAPISRTGVSVRLRSAGFQTSLNWEEGHGNSEPSASSAKETNTA